jgi:hypothetical protein
MRETYGKEWAAQKEQERTRPASPEPSGVCEVCGGVTYL